MKQPRDRYLAWGAPALLVALAAAQMGLAHTSGLSPWKGGGFGMFATVDSPGSRFLRIALVIPGGEVPVVAPPELAGLALECRTWPSPARLERLAAALAAGSWVPVEYESAVEHFRRLDRPAGEPSGFGDLAGSAAAGRPTGLGDLPPDDRRLRLGLLRMRGPEEPDSVPSVAFSAVRVELWRSRFDAAGRALLASPWLAATEARAPTG